MVSMKLVLALAATVAPAMGYESYMAKMPNGDALGKKVGHLEPSGYTEFGKLFKKNGATWAGVCKEMWPGKSVTVGAVLGDPCCKWTSGKADFEVSEPFLEGKTCASEAKPSTAPAAPSTAPAAPSVAPAKPAAPSADGPGKVKPGQGQANQSTTVPGPSPAPGSGGAGPTPAPGSGVPGPAPAPVPAPAGGKTQAPTAKPSSGKNSTAPAPTPAASKPTEFCV